MIEKAFHISRDRKIELMKIDKIDVESKNVPAFRLYTKVNFKEYGRLERGLIRNGQFDDLILLKKDL